MEADIQARKTEIADLSTKVQALEKCMPSKPTTPPKPDHASRLRELESLRETDSVQLVQIQKACEKAIFALCSERKVKAKLVAKRREAATDLERCTALVKQLKDQPDQVQISHDMANKLRQKQKRIAAKQRSFDSQVRALKDEIATLENESASLSHVLQQKNTLIGELEGRITRRNESQDDLERRCEVISNDIEQMGAEITRLRAEKESITTEIREFELAEAKVQSDSAAVARKTDAKHKDLVSLTKELEALVPKYESQLAGSKETLAQTRALSISPLDARISEKQRLVQQCRQAIDQYAKSANDLGETIAQLDRDTQ
jgi:chromosome segregation ATPase